MVDGKNRCVILVLQAAEIIFQGGKSNEIFRGYSRCGGNP